MSITSEPGEASQFRTPFRAEVNIGEFEKIESARDTLQKMREGLLDKPEDKPALADLMIEQFFAETPTGEKKPNEVKMEALRQTYDLLESMYETDINVQVAQKLIDIVRMQDDPGMRLRLASILSHDLQPQYIPSDEDGKISLAEVGKFTAKRTAFDVLAQGSEGHLYRNWARFLLKPKGILEVFNAVYDRGSDLTITPKIVEEITQESDGNERGGNPGNGELYFIDQMVRMAPGWIPSLEKMARYRQLTGRNLPVFLTHAAGKKFISVECPSDITETLAALAGQYRRGEISKSEVMEAERPAMQDFLSRMNPEQRAGLSQYNLEIRFATERGTRKEPNITALQSPPQQAAAQSRAA